MYNRKILIIPLLLLSAFLPVSAQQTIDSIAKVTVYRIGTLDQVNIKFDIDGTREWFEVDGEDFFYDIRPNAAAKARLSINYKFLSAGYAFIPKFIPGNNDNELKGKTKGRGFSFGLNFKKWQHHLRIGTIKGFYLQNSEDFVPNWDYGTTPYIQFPDLKVTSFRGYTSYKFNPHFSFKAITSQTEIQLKSAGSFVPGVNYNFYIIDNKSDDPNQTSSQRSDNYEVLLNVGYFHTFVFSKHWYAALGVTPSGGFSYTRLLTRYPDGDYVSDYSSGVFRFSTATGLGYNGKHLFGGLEFNAFKTFQKQAIETVHQNTLGGNFQVFIGYRFPAPKEVDELVKKAMEKNPF